ncbi:MAG: phosphonate ABC transporter, permease protein PhnE [Nitrospinaceae bacterium]
MADNPSVETPVPRPFYARTKFMAGLLAVLLVYAYGWRVTDIHPSTLWRDAYLVRPLVTALVQPDLVSRQVLTQTYQTPFVLEEDLAFGFAPSPPAPPDTPLRLSRVSGRRGDALTLHAEGLPQDTSGRLFWVNSIDQEIPLQEVTVGSDGVLDARIVVPPAARGQVQQVRLVVTVGAGAWQLSRTLQLTGDKLVETVFLGLMATTLAVLLAAPLSFLGAHNLRTGRPASTLAYYGVRTGFNLLRSVEPLILAILFAVWVGIGPFAGVLALAAHSTAALGKLFSEQIESIDPGPVEAITATGASPLQVVLYGVVPQVVPQFLALSFYRWDINVRMSTIIGFVGGGGIGFLLQQWIHLLQYRQAATALWGIAVVIIILDLVSARVRKRITTV